MRALDSNILLRHLMQDDPVQSPVATRFLTEELDEENPGFVSVAVLCEMVWTLRGTYGSGSERIRQAVEQLLHARQIVVADEAAVQAALSFPGSVSDGIVRELGRAAGCSETVTFDRRFARHEGVRLLGG